VCFLCSFFGDTLVQCAGHVAADSSVSASTALARRRREIRMGKRPVLSDGMSFRFHRLMNHLPFVEYLFITVSFQCFFSRHISTFVKSCLFSYVECMCPTIFMALQVL
jgi:hypothetical protein